MDVVFYDSKGNTINSLTQWDKNVTLYMKNLNLTAPPACHFSNKKNGKTLTVNAHTETEGFSVKVPNVLLQDSSRIMVYIYVHNEGQEEGRTHYISAIPVRARIKPDDYVYVNNIEE